MDQDYILEAEALNELITNHQMFVIDTRDSMEYNRAHIPGAVNIPEIFTYLCTPDNGGLPAMVHYFQNLFGEAGLKPEDDVLVYEDAMDNGYGQSCRGWFLLKYLGHPRVRVLHGGYRAWTARNLPVNSDQPDLHPTNYLATLDESFMVTAEQMLEAIEDPQIIILDNRDYAEWVGGNSSPYGYDYCPRKGRVPGAVWIEWYRLMTIHDGIPWFKTREEILSMCADVGITPDSTVYVYCFKGARASNTLMALRMAGIKDTRNYFPSWNEWSRNFKYPVDEGYPKTSPVR